MKKNVLISSLAVLAITVSSYSSVKAAEIESAEETVGTYGVVNPGGNVTSSFSSIMLKNAARVYQYRIEDKTVPVGTGRFFAKKVQSRGPWDYKHAYGATDKYVFGGRTMKGEDLGNMHYGYVGRFAGFTATQLKTIAGVVQIYSTTSKVKWYKSYFDDPSDQTSIIRGINYYNNKNLPTKSSGSSLQVQALASEGTDFNSFKRLSLNNVQDNNTSLEESKFPNGMTESQFLGQLSLKERTSIIKEARETAEEILENPAYDSQLEDLGIKDK
ncbi:polymorphic toxin type 44 domain-containing protein [Exiguobacterium sp. 17-1]|uniref:polymorphic toxin type 44 domain-containing protein n=1 Tax=Exiguobacterium sp. 17-1 TaxID=2931981 RepID=UPI001FFEC036|nr:polymorphic toxin type 44 domain-containing protein [Exiguobacterium sp. 17-1]MCK2157114.1 polymorphic toxin type 44 domain-containing protein [Exiguobacterium sp. 17-1]